MGKLITVNKELLSVWTTEVSITLSNAKEAGISYNTLKSAIETGKCSPNTESLINKLVFKKRNELKKLTVK